MPSLKFDNPHAFAPMTEPLKWEQDKAPHRTGTFSAVVLHGAPDSQNAGHPLGPIVADPWAVHVPLSVALVADIRVGDRLCRVGIGAEVLTVQQIGRDDSGWLLVCSVRERPTV